MIDRLRTISQRSGWLKPLLYVAAGAALVVFGYVIFIESGTATDVYIIPSIVVVLWSLVGLLVLFIFPGVPPEPGRHQRLVKRLKIRLIRMGYHLAAWSFCALSAIVVWLTIRIVSIWLADF